MPGLPRKGAINGRALTIAQVVDMRREVRKTKTMSLTRYAKLYGVNNRAIKRAIRGFTYKEADVQELPISIKEFPAHRAKLDLKERTQRLYQAGESYNQIKIKLGVSTSSISLWCRELPIHPGNTIQPVYWVQFHRNRFRISVSISGKRKYIGSFDSFQDARDARNAVVSDLQIYGKAYLVTDSHVLVIA